MPLLYQFFANLKTTPMKKSNSLQMKKIKIILAGLLIIAGLDLKNCFAQTVDTAAFDGRIYVKIKDASGVVFNDYHGDTTDLNSDIAVLQSTYGITKIFRPFSQYSYSFCQRTYVFEFNNINAVDSFINDLASISYIEYAEKIPIYKFSFTPNDLFFNGDPNAIVIGSPSAASDNVWDEPLYSFFRHTFCISGTNGANIFWYTRSGTGIYYPSTNANDFSPGVTSIGSTGNLITSAPMNTTCTAPCTSCTRMHLIPIAKDSVLYTFAPAENKWQDKNYAVKKLRSDSSLMSGGGSDDIALQQFYQTEMLGNIGKLRLVAENIADGNISDALLMNDLINPQNALEQNQKTVNDIYLNSIGHGIPTLDVLQTQTLTNIAMQDALDAGPAVYDARVMLNINKDIIVPEDESQRSMSINSENTSQLFRLYPNPNNGVMMLDYNLNANDKGEILIYDITSKLIISYSLNNKINQLIINNEQLNNGIYFYHITVNNKIVKSDKLVIIK